MPLTFVKNLATPHLLSAPNAGASFARSSVISALLFQGAASTALIHEQVRLGVVRAVAAQVAAHRRLAGATPEAVALRATPSPSAAAYRV